MDTNKLIKKFILIISIILIGMLIYNYSQSKNKDLNDTNLDNSIELETQYEESDEKKQSFEEFLNGGENSDYIPKEGSFEEYLNSGLQTEEKGNGINSDDIASLKKINFTSLIKSITKIKENCILGETENKDKSIKEALKNGEKLLKNIKIAKSDVSSTVAKGYTQKCEDMVNIIFKELNTFKTKSNSDIENSCRNMVNYLNELKDENKKISTKK